MMNSGIYQIRNIINGKVYIGSTIDFLKRWERHKKEALGKYHRNKHLQNSILKYGIDNFIFEVLETVDEKTKLFEREQFYINEIKPYNRNIGYNSALKAGGGQLMETGFFAGIKNPMYGKSSKDIIINKLGKDGILKWNEMNKNRSINGKNKGTKPVIQLDKQGNVIKEYISITEAHNSTNINLGLISRVCGTKYSAGGYKWKFKNI